MDIYKYTDYNSMINDILDGEYVINLPIIHDDKKMSFLGNLLSYPNINKSNIHNILVSIINKIKTQLFSEQINNQLLEHVKKEWNSNDNQEIYCNHECNCLSNLKEHVKNKKEYEIFINNLEEKLSDKKTYSQYLSEEDLGEYSSLHLRNLVDDINSKCNTIISSLDKDINLIKNEIIKIKSINIDLLLDMTMKNDTLYKELNSNSDIHKNIQTIYMNYVLLLNLLKKQIYNMENIYVNIKNTVQEKCNNLNEMLKGVKNSEIDLNKKQELSFF